MLLHDHAAVRRHFRSATLSMSLPPYALGSAPMLFQHIKKILAPPTA